MCATIEFQQAKCFIWPVAYSWYFERLNYFYSFHFFQTDDKKSIISCRWLVMFSKKRSFKLTCCIQYCTCSITIFWLWDIVLIIIDKSQYIPFETGAVCKRQSFSVENKCIKKLNCRWLRIETNKNVVDDDADATDVIKGNEDSFSWRLSIWCMFVV